MQRLRHCLRFFPRIPQSLAEVIEMQSHDPSQKIPFSRKQAICQTMIICCSLRPAATWVLRKRELLGGQGKSALRDGH